MATRELTNGAYNMSGVILLTDWCRPQYPMASGELILSVGDRPCVMMRGHGDDPAVRVVHVPDGARAFFDDLLDVIFTVGRFKEHE